MWQLLRNRWLHLQVKSSQSVHVPSAGKRETSVAAAEAERAVLEKKMVLWFCSDYTAASRSENMLTGDCYIHFRDLICQIRIWWAFTCWVHSYDSRNSFPVSQCPLSLLYGYEKSIWGGWVLIFFAFFFFFYHSLNNMFASENIVSHKSKMTCFWSIISPHCGCYLLYV